MFKIITGNIKTGFRVYNDFSKIFYLPQNPYYPKGISVFDYLSSIFFSDNLKWFLSKDEKDKIEKVLSKVDLLDKKDICVENLSGGEIQKLNIGLGLLSGADLFLLDEPASNMDFINQLKILKMLKELTKKGITSVVVMHDINLALKYGDTFFGITAEHKILHQDGIKFFSSSNLKSIFDMNFEILESNGNIYVQSVD